MGKSQYWYCWCFIGMILNLQYDESFTHVIIITHWDRLKINVTKWILNNLGACYTTEEQKQKGLTLIYRIRGWKNGTCLYWLRIFKWRNNFSWGEGNCQVLSSCKAILLKLTFGSFLKGISEKTLIFAGILRPFQPRLRSPNFDSASTWNMRSACEKTEKLIGDDVLMLELLMIKSRLKSFKTYKVYSLILMLKVR